MKPSLDFCRYNDSMTLMGKLLNFAMVMGLSKMKGMGNFELGNQRILALSSLVYSTMNKKHRSAAGVLYNDILVDCLYKGRTCSQAHFKPYLHPSFINCYTFKADLTNTTGLQLDGPNNGLTLILRSVPNVNFMYERLDVMQNVDGIRLAIHAPGTVPFMTKKAVTIEAGKSTSISLSARAFKSLGPPYTNCLERRFFKLDSRTFTSTRDECYEKCMIEKIQGICNCTSTMFEDLTQTDNPYCTDVENASPIQFQEMSECEFGIAQGTNSQSCNDCPWDCEQYEYDIQTSLSEWPQQSKIDNFIWNHVNNQYQDLSQHLRPCSDPLKSFYALLPKKANITENICPENNYTSHKNPFSFMTLTNMFSTVAPGSNHLEEVDNMLATYFMTPGFPEMFEYVADVPQSYSEVKTLHELNAKWVKESFYRVNIYFRQTSVLQHIQEPSVSFPDLCSSIGGVLGLWVGFSVMTIIEVWSFIATTLYGKCSSCCKKSRVVNLTENNIHENA